jgi:hypothetical protein
MKKMKCFDCYLRSAPLDALNIFNILKILVQGKHSSLFVDNVIVEGEIFYNIDSRVSSGLTHIYYDRVESLAWNKHSSLFVENFSVKEETF